MSLLDSGIDRRCIPAGTAPETAVAMGDEGHILSLDGSQVQFNRVRK